MAATTQSDSPSLNTINSLFGTALEFPKCFRKPGTASLFEAKTGSGHLGTRGGALEANPGPLSPVTIDSLGINFHKGLYNISGALTVQGATTILGGFYGRTAAWVLDTDLYSLSSSGNISLLSGPKMKLVSEETLSLVAGQEIIIAASSITGQGSMQGFNISACVGKKDFDIPHPTKNGWRLRHVCIEGPTADVFIKGVLNDSNIIELPEYWTGLVDYETITVNLTPITVYQELFVEKIENNKVIIKNNSGGMIKCNYLICAERKDVEKNIPEYKGEYKDYPGDNSQYVHYIKPLFK
jgi:hypothetical protein